MQQVRQLPDLLNMNLSIVSGIENTLGQNGHRAFLGAYECRCFHRGMMGFGYRLALEDTRNECGGERIAGSYRIGNLNRRGWLERNPAGGEDVASVDAAGQNEHLEVVFAE